MAQGVKMGSFGVAYNKDTRIAVPFVVGDAGPAIGEGSVAPARLAAGLAIKDPIQRSERYEGQVDAKNILWIYFKDAPARYDSTKEAATVQNAKDAFQAWGGEARRGAPGALCAAGAAELECERYWTAGAKRFRQGLGYRTPVQVKASEP